MDIVILSIATALIQFGSHFIPWAQILGKRKLSRLEAYVIGTLTIALILTAYFALLGLVMVIAAIWSVVLFSGVGVFGAYGLDWLIATRSSVRELKQTNSLLMEQRDGQAERN